GKANPSGRLLALLIAGGVILASCAPQASAPQASAPGGGQQAAASPKILRIDNRQESTWGMTLFSGNNDHQKESQFAFHAGLTAYNEKYDIIPRLATKVPSIADGDWKVYPDGTMDVTWKLRANLTWHDGAPFSAQDVAFGYQLMQDPDLATSPTGAVKSVRGTTIQDPLTIVIHYSIPYYNANLSNLNDVSAVPVHLLGDLYKQGD